MTRLIIKPGQLKRKLRVRSKLSGTALRPRLSVFRSNKYVYGQLVDDVTGITLLGLQAEVKAIHKGKNKVTASFEAGKALAAKALEKNISTVVFDRNGFRYHGRVKSFADGAREGGLKF
ncbi:50S ribosomal protein L18 [candidate division WWE3 bacterium]|nr:50S ribosomal protein L18 [candidate division WWE3 bacterium]